MVLLCSRFAVFSYQLFWLSIYLIIEKIQDWDPVCRTYLCCHYFEIWNYLINLIATLIEILLKRVDGIKYGLLISSVSLSCLKIFIILKVIFLTWKTFRFRKNRWFCKKKKRKKIEITLIKKFKEKDTKASGELTFAKIYVKISSRKFCQKSSIGIQVLINRFTVKTLRIILSWFQWYSIREDKITKKENSNLLNSFFVKNDRPLLNFYWWLWK